jgi:hypothetical protein
MFFAVTLSASFVIGLFLAAVLAKGRHRTPVLLGIGLLAEAVVVLIVYLTAPPDALHDTRGCSNCQQYWGRYWEPGWTFFVVGIGYISYLAGLGLGVVVRMAVARRRAP